MPDENSVAMGISLFFLYFNTVCFLHCSKLAMTLTTDATSKSTMNSNLDALSEHPTTIVIPPIAARLVKNEYDAVYKDGNVDNELDGDDGKALDFTDEAVATVIPVSQNATNNHRNETRITYDIGTVTIQTNMQRSATISRDQLNLLGVIKSSSSSSSASSSAMANNNNNATSQKQHKPDAPMLNYIFDAHLANKHRHYDPRYVKTFRFTFIFYMLKHIHVRCMRIKCP